LRLCFMHSVTQYPKGSVGFQLNPDFFGQWP
jgi:hypothetical protein